MRKLQKRARRDVGGFTMVEALVALLVFGVGMLVLMQLAPRASQIGVQGRRISEAMSLAQAKVEELRALPRNDGDLNAGTHTDQPETAGFDRRWEVEDGVPVEGMRRVTVRVGFETTSEDSVAVLVTYF